MSLRQGSGGFTLIEVLVTLAVTAILLSMLGTILTSFLTTQRKVERTLLRERVGAAILDLIARDLEGVYCYDLKDCFHGSDERSGSGEADKFDFVTTRPPAVRGSQDQEDTEEIRRRRLADPLEGGGAGTDPFAIPREPPQLTKVSYEARPSRQSPELLTVFRSESLFVPPPPQPAGQPTAAAAAPAPPPPDAPPPRYQEVYDRVKSFNVRYLFQDRTQSGAAPEWRDKWDEPAEIPAGVEISLEIVPDPKELQEQGFGPERPRRVYKTVVSIPVTQPKSAKGQAGAQGGGASLPQATNPGQ